MSLSNFSQLGNKYILLDLLGIGGMAEVYRCKLVGQQGFEKIIVLKKLLSEAAQDEERVANFIDEARLAALLQHENIGHVYDFGEIDGNYFIAMEYLFGKDLFTIAQKARENKKPIDVEPALFIASKICEGMGYAHSLKDLQGKPLNIIHRDLTPHNVFVTYDGKVKIIDFGVARAELFDNRTKAGVVKGKVSYMSPEQLTEEEVDRRSDIFSIGILLYEMLSGKRMYEGDTATLIRKGMQADYVRLEAICPALPREVYGIVGKALQADRDQRYQSCEEMAATIDDFLYQLKERPGSQRLQGFMHTLFNKEYEAENRKLIETVRKFDELHGLGEQDKTTLTALNEQPGDQDKTVVMSVSEADEAAAPQEEPEKEEAVPPAQQPKASQKGAVNIEEKNEKIVKKTAAPKNKTTKPAATKKQRAQKNTKSSQVKTRKAGNKRRVQQPLRKTSKGLVNVLASLAVTGLLGAAVYYAVVEKGDGELLDRVTTYQEQTIGKIKNLVDKGRAKLALNDEKVETLVTEAGELIADERRGTDRLVEAAGLYQQVLRAKPDNEPARNGLERIYGEYRKQLTKSLAAHSFSEASAIIHSAEEALPGSEKVAQFHHETRRQKQQVIDQLRVKAERAFAVNDLTTPEQRSAYTYYTKILAIDPANSAAGGGLKDIAEKYFAMAEAAVAEGSFSQAHTFAQRGLKVVPDYQPLVGLAEQLPQKFIDQVEEYIADTNFVDARKFAENAQNLYPSNKRIVALLPKVIVKRDQVISDWLKKGESALKNDDLTTPLESSAYTYYIKVLKVDKENDTAQDGLTRIADRYASLATGAFRKLDLPRVRMYLERGLMVEPKHSRLLAIQDDVFTEYEKLVEESLRKNRLAEAEKYIVDLGQVFPRDKRVKGLNSLVEKRKAELIKGYRLKAQRAMTKNNLTTPAHDSAYAYYRKILQIDGDNSIALSGLQRIGDKYATLASTSQRNLKIEEARVYVDRGLKVVPNHKKLLQLKAQLSGSKPASLFRALKKSIDSAL